MFHKPFVGGVMLPLTPTGLGQHGVVEAHPTCSHPITGGVSVLGGLPTRCGYLYESTVMPYTCPASLSNVATAVYHCVSWLQGAVDASHL